MPLSVLANAEGGECKELELDDITLMFFDTLMATLNSAFPGQRREQFDFFEYQDEDGDSLSVRTDEELQTFLVEVIRSDQQNPLQIRLRSSRSPMRQQISFDDSDDFIMASLGPGTSASSSSSTFPKMDGVPMENGGNQPSPMRGRTVGPEDLRLIQRLSDGQFGTVYKALDVRNDRLMAVKCIAIDNANGTRQGLLNEIAILRKCTHPNIVTFHAALFIENQLLICMELMDALSLDLYGKLPSNVLGAVTVAVVEALVHLWSRSIIHRDIKPSNFLVNSVGEVKLGDFGVSKQMAQSIAWSYVGTKVYMAPERMGGEVYNVASDVWSLGVSLAEMALGRFPFKLANDPTMPSIESMGFSQQRINALLNDAELVLVGNGFPLLLSGCIALNPMDRFVLEAMFTSEFLRAHRPMNKQIVGKFIAESREKGQKNDREK